MKSAFFSVFMVIVLVMGSFSAEAARMGGGRSAGKQSSNVTHRETTRQATPAAPAAAPTAAPAAAPKRPWGAMLGGLAAGVGLGMLFNHLGLGGALGSFLMYALLAVLAVVVIRMLMNKFGRQDSRANTASTPYAFGGATPTATSYSPSNVGNDASARPFERPSMPMPLQAVGGGGSMIGSALGGAQSWGVPADFDQAGFLAACKTNFVKLQDAWDKSDIATLRTLLTPEMVTEMQAQLADRGPNLAASQQKNDFSMLNAQLLGIEELPDHYMASVEFAGMMSEDAFSGPKPFREVWNITKPKAGGGWLVAGVQTLE